ncbi:hypothetical protein TRFO_28724 [Tritrichomonas foetus]|uniref:Ubiquitin-like domain-containing protein n=1 Tax=Tritrichomonas foetus TaxID=1144522 RepID=A0A1J4JZ20_9EUKA|nr:hypothetical protein TRFO_28724 [Tritrichomonas foetus]|eukprot:OHT03938.1 hypothetical protein TRFO_28724 [Tritrichomonas foetus]
MNPGNEEIQIVLHKDGEETPFRVKAFDSICSILNTLKNNSPLIFIYQNAILSNALSFSFYGIKNGSHIYAVTPKNGINCHPSSKCSNSNHRDLFAHKKLLSPMISKERFREAYEKKVGKDINEDKFLMAYRRYQDPQISNESAKIKDRIFHQIEGTIKCHRKMMRNFFQNSEKFFNNRNQIHNTENPQK